ncbi:MAG: hypothetical protein AAGG07_04485 [Planctomycetota bacterium]
MSSHAALAPAYVVLPLALMTVLVVATHGWLLLGDRAMPRSRRRIRLANTGVMLLAVPTLAYAFGLATPGQPRAFTVSWAVSIWLLLMVVILAAADSLNTMRLYRRERTELLSGPERRRDGSPDVRRTDARARDEGPA